MIIFKFCQTEVQDRIKFLPHAADTCPHPILEAAGRAEGYAADTIIHEFDDKLFPAEPAISDGEEEAVSDFLGDIPVIDDPEPVGEEHILHPAGPAAIFTGIFYEIDFSFH